MSLVCPSFAVDCGQYSLSLSSKNRYYSSKVMTGISTQQKVTRGFFASNAMLDSCLKYIKLKIFRYTFELLLLDEWHFD